MDETPWYQQIFDDEYLSRYEPHLTAERTAAEVEGVVKLQSLPAGGRILDLCCGHGRHSIALAQRGFQVTGQDLSAPFLWRARHDAERAGVEVQWVRSDMRSIPFTGEFDAVVNLFTAFGYLENEQEDQKVLEAAAAALKPGGAFLMELINRDGLCARFSESGVQRLEDGTLVIDERRIDLVTSRQETRGTTVYPDGRRTEFRFSLRLYTATELVRMLQQAGLEGVAVYGGLDGSRLTLASRRMVLMGHRKGTV